MGATHAPDPSLLRRRRAVEIGAIVARGSALACMIDIDGAAVTVGVSIGVAHRAAGEPLGMNALTTEADRAMYHEKLFARREPATR